MKKSFFVILYILIITGICNSQEEYPYFSVDLTGGGIIPIAEYEISGCIGADVIYHIEPTWAVYGNVTYNILRREYYDIGIWLYPITTSNEYSSIYRIEGGYLEITAGPRAYFSQEKIRTFGEVGIGTYYYHGDKSTSKYQLYFGYNLGGGVEMQLNRNIDIVAKAKSHVIMSDEVENIYVGIYGGVNYNFR